MMRLDMNFRNLWTAPLVRAAVLGVVAFAVIVALTHQGPEAIAVGNTKYPTSIYLNKTLEQRIDGLKLDYKDPHVGGASGFLIGGSMSMDIVLVRTTRPLSTRQLLHELKAHRLHPLSVMELVAFAHQYPDAWTHDPFVALGERIPDSDGYDRYFYLMQDSGRKEDGKFAVKRYGEVTTGNHSWGPDWVFPVQIFSGK